MKKLLIIIGILFAVFVVVVVSGFIFLLHGQKDVLNEEVQSITLTNLDDGTYVGEYDGNRWSNKVEVTVKNHKIVKITVIDDQLLPREDITNKILNQVIEKQSLEVDAVSGTTLSTKAYLKAIEDALSD